MTAESVSVRRERAKELYPYPSFFYQYYHGSTYVSLEDATFSQKEEGTEILINISWDLEDNNQRTNDALTKKFG